MDAVTVKRSARRQKSPVFAAKSGLRTDFCRSGTRKFYGFVVDASNPSQKFVVEILVDGYPIQVVRADAYAAELVKEQIGDGHYGFSCILDGSVVSDSAVVEARLANLGTVVGSPITLSESAEQASQHYNSGTVRWLGGLRFSGWISGQQPSTAGTILVDGIPITRVQPSTWQHVGSTEADARPVRAFDFHLPQRFADGNAHQLVMVDDAGEDIGGGPVGFIAYADGLREAIAGRGLMEDEGLRAQLFDRLLPMSVPLYDYEHWRERFAVLQGPPVTLTSAIIMLGAGAPEETLESLNAQIHSKWIAASLPQTEEPFGVPVALAEEFLAKDGADCDLVVFALAGTVLAPLALQRIAEAFTEFPQAQVVYGDLELQSDDGSLWPLAFPAFDYERMLEQGYCAHLFALRRDIAQRSLEAGASNLYRIFNAMLDAETVSHASIVHLPGPLATLPKLDLAAASLALSAATSTHLQRRGVAARVAMCHAGVFPAARITRAHDNPRTTIIIPTRNRHQLLRRCIESIRPAVERTQAEILIVDNDSSDPETLHYFADIERRGAKILRVPGEFNFSRINNCAAESAHGEVLCLLNNDVKAIDDQWLEEMLGRLAEPGIGAVGAMLAWPSGVVQHGGLVLGPGFTAAHAFSDRLDSDVGYTDLLCVAHECSAVTAACLVTRRRDFHAVGGMDEVRFPLNFNDVDYCLKLRASGKRVVFTPHAKLVHLGSASRGSDVRADHEERFERELQNLRAKWDVVLAADPYYNPMLSRDPIPFSALAWPPGPMTPRVNTPPVAKCVPPGI